VLTGYNGEETIMTGRWNELFFKNDKPITLELACGRGEYCIGLAEKYPDRNFIGVDIKGARIWKGAKNTADKKLTNVAFLRTKIESLALFFSPEEISDLWIKTDSEPFYLHTKEVIEQESHKIIIDSENIYAGNLPHPDLDILTFYERMHLKDNRIIKYLQFQLAY